MKGGQVTEVRLSILKMGGWKNERRDGERMGRELKIWLGREQVKERYLQEVRSETIRRSRTSK